MKPGLQRWRLAGVGLGVVGLALGAALSLAPKEAPITPLKVVLAVPMIPHSGLVHVAFDQGYFREQGLEVEKRPQTHGKAALGAMLQGKADIALAADTPLAAAALDNAPLAILAGIFSTENDPVVIASREAGIATPADLSGKRVGVALGTGGEFVLDVILDAHRVPRERITAVEIAPDDMFDALASGKVQAVSIWYPPSLKIQREMGERTVTFYPRNLYTETFDVVSTRDYVQRNPEVVRRLLKALLRAGDYTRKNPQKALAIVADASGVEPVALRTVWPGFSYRVTLGQSLILSMEDQARWLNRKQGERSRPLPNFLDLVHPDALRGVAPEAVSVIR